MTTNKPKAKSNKPWHPCDDCIDKIKQALQEFVNSEVPGPEVYGYTMTAPSGCLGRAHHFADIEMGRLWLSFNISQSVADEFQERTKSILPQLVAWEDRAITLKDPRDWPDKDDTDDARTGLSRRLFVAFTEIQDEAEYVIGYLTKLGVLIRSKLPNVELSDLKSNDDETETGNNEKAHTGHGLIVDVASYTITYQEKKYNFKDTNDFALLVEFAKRAGNAIRADRSTVSHLRKKLREHDSSSTIAEAIETSGNGQYLFNAKIFGGVTLIQMPIQH